MLCFCFTDLCCCCFVAMWIYLCFISVSPISVVVIIVVMWIYLCFISVSPISVVVIIVVMWIYLCFISVSPISVVVIIVVIIVVMWMYLSFISVSLHVSPQNKNKDYNKPGKQQQGNCFCCFAFFCCNRHVCTLLVLLVQLCCVN